MDTKNEICSIELGKLVSFPEFEVYKYPEEKFAELMENIDNNGILTPIIVRKIINYGGGIDTKYQILSGHHRVRALKELHLTEIPCMVKTGMEDEEAAKYFHISNLHQRSLEELKPSQKAKAYKFSHNKILSDKKSEKIKEEIKKLEDFSNGEKNYTHKKMSAQHDRSPADIARYIRLTELIPQLLGLVDEEKLSIRAGVELSYIKEMEQENLHHLIEKENFKITIALAKKIREESKTKVLTLEDIKNIINSELNKDIKIEKTSSNSVIKIELDSDRFEHYFKGLENQKEFADRIYAALKEYHDNHPDEITK